MSLNMVVLMGNLTRDPELRYSQKGTAVCPICIAVNRVWKNEAGEKQEEVSFIDCTAFGKTAETISQYFKKGKPIIVNGRLKQDTWEDKQTQEKRSKIGVTVESIQFLPTNERTERAAAPAAKRSSKIDPEDMPKKTSDLPPDGDDDVPF